MNTIEPLDLSGLEQDLCEFGIVALPRSASESVPVNQVLEHPVALESLIARIRRWRQAGISVCLSITVNEPDICSHWSLLSAERRDVATLRGLGFAIRSDKLPVHTTCEALDRFFGVGPRFVFLDSQQGQRPGNGASMPVTDNSWSERIATLQTRGLLPVYADFVRSHCPLLPDERSVEVLPGSGLVVPAGSAWQCIRLPLAPLCNRQGDISDTALRRIASDAVRFADDLIDGLPWPDPTWQVDATRNRRVAFILTGIGDVAIHHRLDPGDFGTLRHLSQIVRAVQRALHDASGRLAAERGTVLSLNDTCPASDWFDGSIAESWARQFEEAKRSALVRHRHLLAMSPYSVLPSGASPPAFADLLPLIGQADAWAFSGAPTFDGWNPSQFRDFHRRAHAVIRGSQGHSRVAGGV